MNQWTVEEHLEKTRMEQSQWMVARVQLKRRGSVNIHEKSYHARTACKTYRRQKHHFTKTCTKSKKNTVSLTRK